MSPADNGVAWRPDAAGLERSRLLRFAREHGCATVEALRRKGAADPAWFWESMVDALGVTWSRAPRAVLDLSEGLPWARWFPGAGLNYSTLALDRWVAAGRGDSPALIWEGEEGTARTLNFAEALAEVGRAAHALRSLGVGPGDRVGVFMPLTLECAVATLACARVGAIFTPIFSGYGPGAVATRLVDSGARLLITADGFARRGRQVEMKEVADAATASAPGVERVLVVHRGGRAPADVPWTAGRDVWWHEAVAGQPGSYPAAETGADDPYMVIYTSGTTGRPKGARHVHAGFPLKAAADQYLCFDVQPDDRVLWYSDIGWMMAPWMIQGALLLGAAAVLYDGAPDWPGPDRLWDLVDRHGVSVLGVSPTLVRGLMRFGEAPVKAHRRDTLRAIGSSGETWSPDAWWWCFREVGDGSCPIVNYSGGTEVSGGIVSGTTVEPLRPCAFAGPVPGMAADVVDDAGRPVRGEVGELVVRQPWVGMTQGFWGGPPGEDPARERKARERYLATYWSRFPDTWVHGDWALVETVETSEGAEGAPEEGDPDGPAGAWYILGRSDDTIKLAGKRLGPAEVEGAAAGHPALVESAAVGVPHPIKGEDVYLFCVLRPGWAPGAALADEIAGRVEGELGRALRPGRVLFTRDLPKTRNAKVMRRLIRAVASAQEDLGDVTGLENPGAIDALRESLAPAPGGLRGGTPDG
jgi:acetyl-CoA synthetase